MELITAIIVAAVGGGAVFGFLQFLIGRHDDKDNLTKRVEKLEEREAEHFELLNLLKDSQKIQLGNSIFKTCTDYLERGDYISANELQNVEAMYEQYAALGGNSFAKDLVEQTRDLKINSRE